MARKKRKTGMKLVMVVMALLVVYFSYTVFGQFKKISALESELATKEETLNQIQEENENLEKEIEDSDSLSFIERIARDEYGLVKPKEVIFIDRDKDKNSD